MKKNKSDNFWLAYLHIIFPLLLWGMIKICRNKDGADVRNKIVFSSALAAGISVFMGCVSAPAAADDVSSAAPEQNSALSVQVEAAEPEPFDDWKHRGFGAELPGWIEPAVSGEVASVRKFFPESEGKHLAIVTAAGVNPDQAGHRMSGGDFSGAEVFSDCPDAEFRAGHDKFTEIENFWVRRNREIYDGDEIYVSVKIFIGE